MPVSRITDIKGLNIYDNVFTQPDGALIHAVNVESYPAGAKSKRPGYITYNGTANGSTVQHLFSWTKNDGSLFVYRKSGPLIYYSLQGTADWAVCGNGTVDANTYNIGHDVLGDTLVICDGVGSTRHTTNGTSFTNTTLAPVATDITMFQNRIYAPGTASDLFYSSANDGTNWSTSGTSDSSSLSIPGEGKILKTFSSSDRLIATKTSGKMYKWDGYSLVDMATFLGPSSFTSSIQTEGYYFWINNLGVYGYGGVNPTIVSNPVQPLIYNNMGSAIAGTQITKIPAEAYRYNYYAAIGTVTDDVTNYTIGNCVLRYDYQKNEFLTWQMANNPTAFHSFTDIDGVKQLIFGSDNGQCYKLSGTATTDNGSAIRTAMEFTVHANDPDNDKKWRWITMYFNPGCQAKVQVACTDTYVKDRKNWVEIGDCTSGVVRYRFPEGSRSRLLFVRIYESSADPRYSFYGMSINSDIIPK